MSCTVAIIGTFDSKSDEFAYLRERVLAQGCNVISIDVGVMDSQPPFPVDVAAERIARAGESTLAALRSANDRGAAMKCMATGAARIVADLYQQSAFDGIVGMGGSGGTSVATSAMRALPIGLPKVCVSTVASSDTSPYLGSKDIVLIPSITDVAGLNRVSRRVFSQAAAAICAMAKEPIPATDGDRPLIVASMFGNTTQCVNQCRRHLDVAGYETLVFHAVGSGGRTLEMLIEERFVTACLDITTTEWADEVCGGIFAAGPNRLSAAGRAGIPHLIAPGCIDMVNFGPIDTVPRRYVEAKRLLYQWNPSVTLMRTNVEENRALGQIFAEKANAATGPVAVVLPLRGVSMLDGDGQRFCDREADTEMFETLKSKLRAGIPVIEVDANINDAAFARAAVDALLKLIEMRSDETG